MLMFQEGERKMENSTCKIIQELNQRLLVVTFGDMGNANRLKEWGMEA